MCYVKPFSLENPLPVWYTILQKQLRFAHLNLDTDIKPTL